MKNLPFPALDDKAIVDAACKTKRWTKNRKKDWKKAYKAYEAATGDAGALTKWKTKPSIDQVLYDLYDTKSQTDDFRAVRSAFVGCCAMCGSDATMDLDHFIPRGAFQEFAVFSKNLVPTCPYCNRGVKKTTVMGPGPQDRFLHPYYHTLLARTIWRATFRPPYAAVVFGWEPEPTITGPDRDRVQFHLNHVLGEGYQKGVLGYWETHLDVLRTKAAAAGGALTSAQALHYTQEAMSYCYADKVRNAWRPAFFRGLIADPAALAWLAAEAAKPTPTPTPTPTPKSKSKSKLTP